MVTKFNHLLTGKSRNIYWKSMHRTVNCELVGALVQQKKIDKMMCEITGVSASDSKKRYPWVPTLAALISMRTHTYC